MIPELMALNNIVLSSVQLTLAVLIMHRAIPSVIGAGKAKAWKIWLLAMALAIFGVAYLTDYMADRSVPLVRHLGHYALLGYAWARYRGIIGRGICPWGHTRRA